MWPEHLILSPLPFPPHRASPRRVERPGIGLCSFSLSGHELQLFPSPSGPGQALPTHGAPPLSPPGQLPLQSCLGPGPVSVPQLLCGLAATPHPRLTKYLVFLGFCLVSSTSPAAGSLPQFSRCPLCIKVWGRKKERGEHFLSLVLMLRFILPLDLYQGKNPSKGTFDLFLARRMNTFPQRKHFTISCCFR